MDRISEIYNAVLDGNAPASKAGVEAALGRALLPKSS